MSAPADPTDGDRPPGFSNKAKVEFIRRMASEDWEELADLYGISTARRRRFREKQEPRDLWNLVESQGRLHELPGHLDTLGHRDIARDLRESARTVAGLDGPAHPPPCPRLPILGSPPAAQQAVNSDFFDLEPVRHALTETSSGALGNPTVFVLPCSHPIVGCKVIDWLPYCFDNTVCKTKLTLGPLLTAVDAAVQRMGESRHELASSHVAWHVDATRAPRESILALFDRLVIAVKDSAHSLIVILTVTPDVTLPAPFVQLPRVTFQPVHVASWAQPIVKRWGWPPRLSNTWAAMVSRFAYEEDGLLDPARTYEELDRSIEDLLNDSEGFRSRLEKEDLV